jgi:HAE1 family hydrophobic/amphiphilic exporter-1
MDFLSKISVRRPVFATVLMLTIVVVGLVGYRSLGVDKFPRIDFPMVVDHHGLPRRVAGVGRVRRHRQDRGRGQHRQSASRPCRRSRPRARRWCSPSSTLEKDPDVAAQEIRDRIATIRDLPTSIRPPQIQKADPDASPVLMLSVKGDAADRRS